MSPDSEVDHSKEHIYTKLQVHHAGDIQDLVLETEKEPTCRDLAKAVQQINRNHSNKISICFSLF